MNLLKYHRVYLLGPIDNAEDFGRGWRRNIKDFLWNLGCGVFDPTDKPLGLIEEDESSIKKRKKWKQNNKYSKLRKEMKKIVTSDLAMLDRSDIVVAYLNNDIQMTGTIGEIHYCALEKKPCLIMCEQGKSAIADWLWGIGLDHNLFFNSWDEIKGFITQVNNGDIVNLNDDWKMINYNKVYNFNS